MSREERLQELDSRLRAMQELGIIEKASCGERNTADLFVQAGLYDDFVGYPTESVAGFLETGVGALEVRGDPEWIAVALCMAGFETEECPDGVRVRLD